MNENPVPMRAFPSAESPASGALSEKNFDAQ
jgi:hypothetical protein